MFYACASGAQALGPQNLYVYILISFLFLSIFIVKKGPKVNRAQEPYFSKSEPVHVPKFVFSKSVHNCI